MKGSDCGSYYLADSQMMEERKEGSNLMRTVEIAAVTSFTLSYLIYKILDIRETPCSSLSSTSYIERSRAHCLGEVTIIFLINRSTGRKQPSRAKRKCTIK